MRVADMIDMLQAWKRKHGPDAQISVPRSQYERRRADDEAGSIGEAQFGEEIFIYNGNVSTYLDSRGPEVQW